MATFPLYEQLGPGSILSHFKLTELIGSGGMGLVFKAVDTRLDRTVAIKVLSPELFENELAKARFLREAKITAAFTHHNVATIHEIDEHEGIPFIVMELVPGSTLKHLACSNPLPLRKVLSIGKQVCDALEASHRLGIIHRDIKSSNIMVKPDGQIKVLDFGLAKALEAHIDDADETKEKVSTSASRYGVSLTTAHGVALGTPSYMSPEQASGKPVDPRTDIFSLGIVLYEALSGDLPFKGRSDQELLEAIRSKDPPPLHVDGGRVPRAFTRVLSTCLSKEPECRYPSAAALRETLSRLETPFPAMKAALDKVEHSHFGRLGLATTLIALVAILIRWPPQDWFQTGAEVPPGTKLVLTALGNPADDPYLAAVETLLETQLRQSSHTSLVQLSDIERTLQQMVVPRDRQFDTDLAREVAWRLGSPLLASVSLLRVGADHALTVQLDRIGDSPEPEATWAKDFRVATQDSLYDAVDDASYWIRKTIGESAEEIAKLNTPAREATTSSWEALDLYARANDAQHAGRNDEARTLLKEAVDLDPDFALAWGRLADISYSAEQEQIYAYHREALNAMKRRRVTKYEELRIKAVFAHDGHDNPKAIRFFRTFALTYPRDYVALSGYGYSLCDLGEEEEALRAFQRAEAIRPQAFTAFLNSARTSLVLGRFEEATSYIERLRELGFDDAAALVQGHMHFIRGDYPQAVDALSRLNRSKNTYWKWYGVNHLSEILVELGRWKEAQSVLQEGITSAVPPGLSYAAADYLLALAQIHLERGELEACRKACLAAMKHDRGAVRLMRAGWVLGRAGFYEEAERIHDELPGDEDVPLYVRAQHRILGEVLLSQGNLQGALDELQQARALEAPAHENEYLARAVLASGELEEARQYYEEMSNSLARLLWHDCLVAHPGLWAKTLFMYAETSYETGQALDARIALERYLALRINADKDIAEVHRARHLLELVMGDQT